MKVELGIVALIFFQSKAVYAYYIQLFVHVIQLFVCKIQLFVSVGSSVTESVTSVTEFSLVSVRLEAGSSSVTLSLFSSPVV